MARLYVITAAGVVPGTIALNRDPRRGRLTGQRIARDRRELRIALERQVTQGSTTTLAHSPARWIDAALVHETKREADRAYKAAARAAGIRTIVEEAMRARGTTA